MLSISVSFLISVELLWQNWENIEVMKILMSIHVIKTEYKIGKYLKCYLYDEFLTYCLWASATLHDKTSRYSPFLNFYNCTKLNLVFRSQVDCYRNSYTWTKWLGITNTKDKSHPTGYNLYDNDSLLKIWSLELKHYIMLIYFSTHLSCRSR